MSLHLMRKVLGKEKEHRGYERFGSELEQRRSTSSHVQGFTWNSFLSGCVIGFIHRGRVQPTPQRYKR